jgi:hypothetical protein
MDNDLKVSFKHFAFFLILSANFPAVILAREDFDRQRFTAITAAK